ncbi:MAG TPA: GntR family transcriptional regulator [Polyangia bacterium]|nr:GntR family transcriptional regulator [Polyangia bacterium]
MRIPIDPQSPLPLHAQIAEGILLAIATGELAPGDQLPTVRQLSVDLKVNSNTVARVYADLEGAGVLETCRGRGTFVKTRPKVQPGARERRLDTLVRSFLRVVSEEGFSLAEVRRALRALAEKTEGVR